MRPGPSQEGLFGHFSAIAETTGLPIVLYSIPARCGIEIGVPVVERLRARYPHVRWIKESGGSVDRVDQLKQALGSDITVLSGDDSLTLPFMAVGAVREVRRMVHSALDGDFAAAGRLHRKLYPLFKALFMEPSPAPIKAALARAGLISSPEVRSPLCGLTPATGTALAGVLSAIGR
jgi:4-hydroxy-tetrahydrodipicolinate synthase